jgi:hypothetical protein
MWILWIHIILGDILGPPAILYIPVFLPEGEGYYTIASGLVTPTCTATGLLITTVLHNLLPQNPPDPLIHRRQDPQTPGEPSRDSTCS